MGKISWEQCGFNVLKSGVSSLLTAGIGGIVGTMAQAAVSAVKLNPDGSIGWDYKVALSSLATSALSAMGDAAFGDSFSGNGFNMSSVAYKTLIESPLSTALSSTIQGNDITFKDIGIGMLTSLFTSMAQEGLKKPISDEERNKPKPPLDSTEGMLTLLFGSMIAAAARRESADPSDPDSAQTCDTGNRTGDNTEENDILSMVGTSDSLLISPSTFGIDSEIAMYSADDAVMSECQTEPENNKLTSNSFNVESAFGTAPAPFDLTDIEKILNEEVIVETPYRSPSDVEVMFQSTYEEDFEDPTDVSKMFGCDSEHQLYFEKERQELIENFINDLLRKVGRPYVYGGGNISVYQGVSTLDANGNYRGFDCIGGIMDSLRNTTGLNIPPTNVPELFEQEWLDLVDTPTHGDLIFVDRKNDGNVSHVMTYNGEGDMYNLITTVRDEYTNGMTTNQQRFETWRDDYYKNGTLHICRINWELLKNMYQPITRR